MFSELLTIPVFGMANTFRFWIAICLAFFKLVWQCFSVCNLPGSEPESFELFSSSGFWSLLF
jgi:hypothetical protein